MAKLGKKFRQPKVQDDKAEASGYVPIRGKKNFKVNKAPKADELNEQYIPRKIREIKELQEAMKNPEKRHKFKKNAVLEEAKKHGFERRPWEDNRGFTKRIARETRESINHEMIKVRHAVAGRDINEIKEDYKQLDEAAKRKKALKIMRREKLAKLRAKGKIPNDVGNEEKESDEEDTEVEDSEEEEPEPKKVKKQQKPGEQPKVKKLTKNERIRAYKKEAKEAAERELLLNAREVIKFGERVDAPPTFSKKFQKELAPGFANAGSKDLLLKRIMEQNKPKPLLSSPVKKSKSSNVSAEERQKIIDMHRALKKAKQKESV